MSLGCLFVKQVNYAAFQLHLSRSPQNPLECNFPATLQVFASYYLYHLRQNCLFEKKSLVKTGNIYFENKHIEVTLHVNP